MHFRLRSLALSAILLLVCVGTDASRRSYNGAKIKPPGVCPKGLQPVDSQETELNHHTFWETAWGRTGASWPKRGTSECWENRGAICQLPDEEHVVCLPGSRRGSTVNRGWAMDPRSQSCQPGVHCLYACEPGYYWTQFNQKETSNFDKENAKRKGSCDGTWDYGTSTHGVYCDERGVIQKPYPGPLCRLGETYVFAENRLDTHFFLCQTVFPGHEIFLIPTLVKPGETVMITTQPKSFWTGPSSSKPTHGDFYVSFAGADIMEACTWDEFSPSGAALLPYEIGSGVEDNGVVYSTHYFYQQPNSEVPSKMVGYEMALECTSKERNVCGEVVRSGGVVKLDVLKKPRMASSKVKFILQKPDEGKKHSLYKEPKVTSLDPDTLATVVDSTAYPGYVGGRKLKHVDTASTPVFLENALNVPVVLCEQGAPEARPLSVGPKEVIQVKGSTSFLLASSGSRCDAGAFSWKLWTGTPSPTGLQFGYTAASNDVSYGLFLHCVSESERCRSVNSSTTEVDDMAGDSTLRVTFVIRAFSSPASRPEAAYEWASSFRQWLSSVFQS